MTERSLFWKRHLEAIEAEVLIPSAYARREGLALGLLYQFITPRNGAVPTG